MEDNFYKTSSEKLFPKSEKASSYFQKNKREYEDEAPIISETIERFKKQVAYYESVRSIQSDIKDKPEELMREVVVNKRIAAILDSEIRRLERIVKTYSKK